MSPSAFEKLFRTYAPHALEKIFFSLDYKSYKACHLVCRGWNDHLTQDSFEQRANKIVAKNNEMLRNATSDGNVDEAWRMSTVI